MTLRPLVAVLFQDKAIPTSLAVFLVYTIRQSEKRIIILLYNLHCLETLRKSHQLQKLTAVRFTRIVGEKP